MQILFAHSIAAGYGPLAERVKAIGALYGRKILLPDRSPAASDQLSGATLTMLAQSALVVGFVSVHGQHHRQVIAEIRQALAMNLPVLVLVEDGARIELPSGVVRAHFARDDFSQAETELRNFLHRHAPATKEDNTAEILGIAALIVFAITLLVVAATRDKNVGPKVI